MRQKSFQKFMVLRMISNENCMNKVELITFINAIYRIKVHSKSAIEQKLKIVIPINLKYIHSQI